MSATIKNTADLIEAMKRDHADALAAAERRRKEDIAEILDELLMIHNGDAGAPTVEDVCHTAIDKAGADVCYCDNCGRLDAPASWGAWEYGSPTRLYCGLCAEGPQY